MSDGDSGCSWREMGAEQRDAVRLCAMLAQRKDAPETPPARESAGTEFSYRGREQEYTAPSHQAFRHRCILWSSHQ